MGPTVQKKIDYYDRELKKLQQLFGKKLRLQAELQLDLQQQAHRDKVLCDLFIHQQFYEQILAAVHCGTQQTAQELWQVLQQATATDAAAALKAECSAEHLHDHQQQQQQQPLLPDSYVARMLRQVTVEQIERVLQMTTQDWVQFHIDVFPRFLTQIEVCSRSEYDYDTTNPLAHQHHQQQPQQQPPPPPGASPAADRQRLQQLIDTAMQHSQLGYLLTPMSTGSATQYCLDRGPSQPSPEHWEAVADRLQLTEVQELHISICMARLKRMQDKHDVEGRQLLQQTEEPTLQLAAAQRQQQQGVQVVPGPRNTSTSKRARESAMLTAAAAAAAAKEAAAKEAAEQRSNSSQPHSSGTISSCSAAGVEEGEEAGDDLPVTPSIDLRLQQLMLKRHVQLLCAQCFIINTLSLHQMAIFKIASYPYVPAIYIVGTIIQRRLQQRKRQYLKDVEQSACLVPSMGHRGAVSTPSQHETSHQGRCVLDPAAAAAAARASNADGDVVPYSQWLLQRHLQQREQELLLHQRACWAQMHALQQQQQQQQQQEQLQQG